MSGKTTPLDNFQADLRDLLEKHHAELSISMQSSYPKKIVVTFKPEFNYSTNTFSKPMQQFELGTKI